MNNSKKTNKKTEVEFFTQTHSGNSVFVTRVKCCVPRSCVRCYGESNRVSYPAECYPIWFSCAVLFLFCCCHFSHFKNEEESWCEMLPGRNPCYHWRLASQLPHTWPEKRKKIQPPFNKLHSMRRSFLPPVGATLQSKKYKSRNSAAEPAEGFINNNKKCASSPSARCEYVRLGTWLWKPRLALLQLWVW